jgi:hypothetical protein
MPDHRWLLSKGHQEAGREALRKMLTSDEAAKEAADISVQVERERLARMTWVQALKAAEFRGQLCIGGPCLLAA